MSSFTRALIVVDLYSASNGKFGSISPCIVGAKGESLDGHKFLCRNKALLNGEFKYTCVPPGKYKVSYFL